MTPMKRGLLLGMKSNVRDIVIIVPKMTPMKRGLLPDVGRGLYRLMGLVPKMTPMKRGLLLNYPPAVPQARVWSQR